MGVVALGWSSGRFAEDGHETGRVETELHPRLVQDHNSVSWMCRCLSLRRRVKLGIPRPAGGRGVNVLEGIGSNPHAGNLEWAYCCGRRLVIDLTDPVE